MVSREYVYNSKRNNRNKQKEKQKIFHLCVKRKKQKPLGKIDDNFVLKIYYGLYRKKKQKTKMKNYVKDSEAICSNLVNSNTFENKMRIFNKRLERQNKIKTKKTKQKQMKMKL